MKFRTGRKVGRTLYVQINDQPDDMDLLIGIVDSSDQADIIVTAVNAVARIRELHTPQQRGPANEEYCSACGTMSPCPTIRTLEDQ